MPMFGMSQNTGRPPSLTICRTFSDLCAGNSGFQERRIHKTHLVFHNRLNMHIPFDRLPKTEQLKKLHHVIDPLAGKPGHDVTYDSDLEWNIEWCECGHSAANSGLRSSGNGEGQKSERNRVRRHRSAWPMLGFWLRGQKNVVSRMREISPIPESVHFPSRNS